jgi:hypothetical protein
VRIELLVLHRKESYPGELAPEIVDVVDEYSLDEYPQGWADRVAEHKREIGNEASAWALVATSIEVDDLMAALYPLNEVENSGVEAVAR